MELAKLKKTLATLATATPRIKLVRQARIDYYILEDQPQGPSKPLETGHPLKPVPPPGNSKKKHLAIGVDSSSSIIRTPFYNIVAVTASASTTIIPELYDHPEIYSYQIQPRIKQPYLIIGTDAETEETGEGVTTTSPLGTQYGYKYSPERIADEYRAWIENWVLSDPLLQAAEKLVDQGYNPVILIDGPIYPTPQLIAKIHPAGDALSLWRRIAEDRINIVRHYENMGIPVVGIVKRVDQSSLLTTQGTIRRLVKTRCGIDLVSYNPPGDQALIHLLLTLPKCRRHGTGIYRTPVHQYTPGNYVFPKLYSYIAIPPSPWSTRTSDYRVYRLEFTGETMEILRGHGLDPFQVVYNETLHHGLQVPFTITLSDKRSRMIASALRAKLKALLQTMRVPFTYDEIVYGR